MTYEWVVTLGAVIDPKKSSKKLIVIGQIIGLGKIDTFCFIESIIKSNHFPNIGIESIKYSIENEHF